MARNKTTKPSTSAVVKITLELNVPLGSMTLEEALVKAHALKAQDIVDTAEDVDWNDCDIKVTGLWQ